MLLIITRLISYLVPPNIMSFDPMRQQQCLRRGHGPWPETFRLTHTLVSNTKQQKREIITNNHSNLPQSKLKVKYWLSSPLVLIRDNERNNIIQMENDMVKNPNWWEANQLALLQAWMRMWTQNYRQQIQRAVRERLELRASRLQIQCYNHYATLAPQVIKSVTPFPPPKKKNPSHNATLLVRWPVGSEKQTNSQDGGEEIKDFFTQHTLDNCSQ